VWVDLAFGINSIACLGLAYHAVFDYLTPLSKVRLLGIKNKGSLYFKTERLLKITFNFGIYEGVHVEMLTSSTLKAQDGESLLSCSDIQLIFSALRYC
jgi:hypothetical protein